MTSTRTLRRGEKIPPGFNTGFEEMPVISEWVWVAEQDSKAVGVLIASPMHGLVYLVRVSIVDGNNATALLLFRAMLKEAKLRGCRGYVTHVNPMLQKELKLVGMCRNSGGVQVMLPQVMLVGSVEEAAKV